MTQTNSQNKHQNNSNTDEKHHKHQSGCGHSPSGCSAVGRQHHSRQYQHISNEQRLTESNSAREHNQMVYLPSSHIRPDRLHQLNRRTDKTMTNHTNQSKTLSQSNPYILRHLPRYGLLIILNCSTSGPTLQVEEEHIKNNK